MRVLLIAARLIALAAPPAGAQAQNVRSHGPDGARRRRWGPPAGCVRNRRATPITIGRGLVRDDADGNHPRAGRSQQRRRMVRHHPDGHHSRRGRWRLAGIQLPDTVPVERVPVGVDDAAQRAGLLRSVRSGDCHPVIRDVRLSFTWNSHLHEGSLVTIELRPVAEGTELTLTHSGLPTEALRTAHDQGWAGCLANFERAAQRSFAVV